MIDWFWSFLGSEFGHQGHLRLPPDAIASTSLRSHQRATDEPRPDVCSRDYSWEFSHQLRTAWASLFYFEDIKVCQVYKSVNGLKILAFLRLYI